jgi:hypothetical protein
MELAKKWLDCCIDDHPNCDREDSSILAPSWIPTRLLDVGEPSDMRTHLIISKDNDKKAHYLALSHCWGGAEICKLLTSNINDKLANIPWEELPKTFKDAISITRKLGFRYIWIDSLCILQDCREDWASEAALMGNVYKYSACTIAATGSSSSYDGCFFERHPRPMWEYKIAGNPFENLNANIKGPALVLVGENWDSSWSLNVERASPLSWRGWTFQERVLSKRILHFGRIGLSWECNSLSASEFCQDGFPPGNFYMEEGQPSKPSCDIQEHDYQNNSGQSFEIWSRWIKFVEDYSEKKFTFKSDRLIAISAIAKEVQFQLKYMYFAGLWKETMPLELCWTVDWEKASEEDNSKETEYRAPSWSWASNDFPVFFPFHPPNLRNLDVSIWCRVIDTSVTPTFQDPTGQVKTAHLTLEGPLKPAIVVQNDERDRPNGIFHTLLSITKDNLPFRAWVSMDTFVPLHKGTETFVSVLPIVQLIDICENSISTITKAPRKGTVQALLLQKVDQGPNYIRVGSLTAPEILEKDDWFHLNDSTDEDTSMLVQTQIVTII